MSKIIGGVQRDALDAASREARRLAKLAKDETEIALPGWTPPELPMLVMRRVVDRTHSSGHKVVFKLVPMDNQ